MTVSERGTELLVGEVAGKNPEQSQEREFWALFFLPEFLPSLDLKSIALSFLEVLPRSGLLPILSSMWLWDHVLNYPGMSGNQLMSPSEAWLLFSLLSPGEKVSRA